MPLKKYTPSEDYVMSYFMDDFVGGLYQNRYWATRAGSGSVSIPVSSIGGILLVRANASNYYEVYQSVGAFTVARKVEVVWRGKVDSLTSSRAAFGLQFDVNNRIEWLYEAALGANWRARSVASSVETVVDTGVAADTNYHEFRIVTDTGLAHFMLDNVPLATIVTNVPTGNLSPFLRSTSTTSATRDIYADWVEIYGERL
jgi:hypothetical protein